MKKLRAICEYHTGHSACLLICAKSVDGGVFGEGDRVCGVGRAVQGHLHSQSGMECERY